MNRARARARSTQLKLKSVRPVFKWHRILSSTCATREIPRGRILILEFEIDQANVIGS